MAGYFESLTRIHENPQCPCFRRLNTLYPSINQDRSSGRHRRCGTTIAPSRRVASGRLRVNRPTWYSTPYPPLPSPCIRIRYTFPVPRIRGGTPHARRGSAASRLLEESLGRSSEFVEQLVAVTTTSVCLPACPDGSNVSRVVTSLHRDVTSRRA